jgi:hypothetical protein
MVCKLKKSWVKMELEHAHNFPKGKRMLMARKIATDHIKELGCGYYPALKQMEMRLKKRK